MVTQTFPISRGCTPITPMPYVQLSAWRIVLQESSGSKNPIAFLVLTSLPTSSSFTQESTSLLKGHLQKWGLETREYFPASCKKYHPVMCLKLGKNSLPQKNQKSHMLRSVWYIWHLHVPWSIWESHGASGNPMEHLGIQNKIFQNKRSHEPYTKVISLKRSSCMVMHLMRLLNFKQHIISRDMLETFRSYQFVFWPLWLILREQNWQTQLVFSTPSGYLCKSIGW